VDCRREPPLVAHAFSSPSLPSDHSVHRTISTTMMNSTTGRCRCAARSGQAGQNQVRSRGPRRQTGCRRQGRSRRRAGSLLVKAADPHRTTASVADRNRRDVIKSLSSACRASQWTLPRSSVVCSSKLVRSYSVTLMAAPGALRQQINSKTVTFSRHDQRYSAGITKSRRGPPACADPRGSCAGHAASANASAEKDIPPPHCIPGQARPQRRSDKTTTPFRARAGIA